MKKFLISLLAILTIGASAIGLTACGGNGDKPNNNSSREEVSVEESVEEKHEHQWNGYISKQATCEMDGVYTFVCYCGEYYTSPIESLGHSTTQYEGKAPTCAEYGWEAYEKCQRDACMYSTYAEIPATGEHNYVKGTCSVCNGKQPAEEHTHEWDNGAQTTAPTCTEKGVKTFTCWCENTYTESIPALEHDLAQYEMQAATCTSMGWNAYEKCKRDGCGYSTYQELPALAHSFTDYIYNNDATCQANGTETATCGRLGCNAKDTREKANSKTAHATVEEWYTNDTHHWKEYTCQCEGVADYGKHTVESSGRCSVCAKVITFSEGVVYDISADGTYMVVVDYKGNGGDIVIASTYNGLPVKKISVSAFKNKDNITSVYIPDSVTSIGGEAFYDCSRLTSVVLSESVTSIGWDAFEVCSSLMSVYITDIEAWCNIDFAYDDSNPLYYAKNLYLNNQLVTDLVIPDTVQTIKQYAFYNYSNLTSIEIGKSVTSIGSRAFYDCSSLTSVIIPDSVTSIGGYAFYDCSRLTSVVLSESVTSIGGYAFYYCDKLQYNEYGNAKYLGSADNPYYALIKVTTKNLTSYQIHEDTKVIADCAFYGCSSLTNITIPDSVTSIGGRAFEDCSSLTNITIPDSVTSIGYKAFSGCNSLTSVEIPDSVTSIGSYAFSGCNSLTSVVIPDSVTSIGSHAFWSCDNLTSITIGDSVTSIGDYAFDYCSSLTSVTIGDSVTSIGDYAFRSCSSLTSVYITDIAAWCNIDFADAASNPLYYAKNLYLNNQLVTELVIPESVTSIGGGAFFNCSSLTKVVIGDSVTSIGRYAFSGCSSLTKVVLGESVTSIGAYAFYECSSLTSATFKNTEGWTVQYSTNTPKTLSSEDLSNTSTAAQYLRNYYDYTWTREE